MGYGVCEYIKIINNMKVLEFFGYPPPLEEIEGEDTPSLLKRQRDHIDKQEFAIFRLNIISIVISIVGISIAALIFISRN